MTTNNSSGSNHAWLIRLQQIIEASNLLNAGTKNFFSEYTSVDLMTTDNGGL
jgi:hypothetical protein